MIYKSKFTILFSWRNRLHQVGMKTRRSFATPPPLDSLNEEIDNQF